MTVADSSTLEELSVEMVPVPKSEGTSTGELPLFEKITGRVERFEITPELFSVFTLSPPLAEPVDLQGSFEGTPEAIQVEGSGAVDGGGTMTVDGTVDITKPSYDVELGLDGFELGEWLAAEIPEVSFDATGSLTGTGVSFGEHLRASVELVGSDITFGDIEADELRL
ncbi:MAG: hypothetical protein ABEN55_22225, partial [Bradymonadaceae bacterium]